MRDGPPERSFFIGRWQPLHAGHVRLIRTALDEGRPVVIGIMDTPTSKRNPHSFQARMHMFWKEFGPEVMGYDGPMQILKMPWIDEVVYGRDCGWRCRRIRLDAETEQNHSGTASRAMAGGTG